MLDFSKLENGKVELCKAALDVQELVEDSIRMCQYSIQKNSSVALRSQVHNSCPKSIIGDQARLRQVKSLFIFPLLTEPTRLW